MTRRRGNHLRWQRIEDFYFVVTFTLDEDYGVNFVPMLDHVITGMIIYTITEEYLHRAYSSCQYVIRMHHVYLSSRCLLMKKMYVDGGKSPKTTKLLKRSTITLPIDFQVNFCAACSIMNGECYDDYNVADKRTAA